MSILTVVYVLLMVGGIIWLVHRISIYLKKEREREASMNESYFVDDQFKNYLNKLNKSKGNPQKEENTP
jgi:hypothetical protein